MHANCFAYSTIYKVIKIMLLYCIEMLTNGKLRESFKTKKVNGINTAITSKTCP